jgi:manganese oxidase
MHPRNAGPWLLSALAVLVADSAVAQTCARTVSARVAAFDQPFMLNRLGAAMPSGQTFALLSDVVPKTCYDPGVDCARVPLVPGKIMLRRDKRPRPIVLRANQGDCLKVELSNFLDPVVTDPNKPTTRWTSIHMMGLEWTKSSTDDGSFVGANPLSIVPPAGSSGAPKLTYTLYAAQPGAFLLYSTAANFGGNTDLQAGNFGAVIVEPKGAEWYRSQVTRADLDLATLRRTPDGHPVLDYNRRYPAGHPRAGKPILRMLDPVTNELAHTDLTAVITGPNHGRFAVNQFPANYAEPDRSQPFREFTIIYHEVFSAVQAFPDFYDPTLGGTLGAGQDSFAINYGTGGIGAEILANRYGVGPEGGCADCKFEEFFLSSWAVGDPAMVVDVPANTACGPGLSSSNPLDCVANCSPLPNCSTPGSCTPQQQACVANCPASPQCTVAKGQLGPDGIMIPKRKATYALYPDDPSNVYHSYINDHVTFHILHGGTAATHVHHQHAHQWLHSPNNPDSTYLDSQMISPGAAYTLEIDYNGGGNRNKTVGDSIFHCHFYPHFAGGMWSLWRTHDVFEGGTLMQGPVPAPGYSRALPDGEIAAGTPIPAVVPLPTLAMAPLPARTAIVPVKDPGNQRVVAYQAQVAAEDKNVNPGFPFFVPGLAGTRAPHPPLDFAADDTGTLDGGLPRHLVFTGAITNQQTTRFDFSKDLGPINAYRLPENGTAVEQSAFAYHSVCFHKSFLPDGTIGQFRTNGLKPTSGAPFADPALDPAFENANREDTCANNQAHPLPASKIRRYKAAAFETDLVLNKGGWHFPQARMLSLWQDVMPTLSGARPAEPFFFRANSGEAVEYWHTNLIPDYYLVDDFQVRTPTDVIGQHIHLVKFDVTSSDGAGNGFNYEDGTFSPDEVRARIDSINRCGGLLGDFAQLAACRQGVGRTTLTRKAPPKEICLAAPGGCPAEWYGAQTTVQRWFADPLLNGGGADRTLRTVFTHDHFGPSTHQQTGLYAALVVEPANSSWAQSETGEKLGTRSDGGPTTWEAVIGNGANSYREFLLALQDFNLAYNGSSKSKPDLNPSKGWIDTSNAINPPERGACPSGVTPPCPTIVSVPPGPIGTQSFNYRNEPLALRVRGIVPGAPCPQSSGPATDLASVFRSDVPRNDCAYNSQPIPGRPISPGSGFTFPKPLTAGLFGGDPFTPLLRAYENDKVQVRVIAGAHVFPHSMYFNGLKWQFEPGTPGFENNSGYRNTQSIGISEHFEFLMTVPRTKPVAGAAPDKNFSDYLYMTDAGTQLPGLSDGMWGLVRAYRTPQAGAAPLQLLPNNPTVKPLPQPTWEAGYSCPPGVTLQPFDIVAVPITGSLNGGSLIYNPRGPGFSPTPSQPINSTSALVYIERSRLATLKPGDRIEPLILRARAGDCIKVTQWNNFGDPRADGIFKQGQTEYGVNMFPSRNVGLHAQLLSYDVTTSDGMNAGFNPLQTVIPTNPVTGVAPQSRTYYWYAGNLSIDLAGTVTGQPVEFGPVVLRPADPLLQNVRGLVGALIVEPPAATWKLLPGTTATADVSSPTASFREFVAVNQDDLTLVGWPPPGNANTVNHAVNYRNESMYYRYNNTSLNGSVNIAGATANLLVGGNPPQTPGFEAPNPVGSVRLRMLHPGGGGSQHAMTLHGHVWQEEPFTANSTRVGSNSASQWLGSRDLHGPNDRFEIVLPRAGGTFGAKGAALYRTFFPGEFQDGFWGVLNVGGAPLVAAAALAAEMPPSSEGQPATVEPEKPNQKRPADFNRQPRQEMQAADVPSQQ